MMMRSYQLFQKIFKRSEGLHPRFPLPLPLSYNSKYVVRALSSVVTLNATNIYLNTHFYSTQQQSNEEIEVTCIVNPHPAKRKTGGEDAYYFSANLRSFGVADGVGGWINHGVDAGLYSKRLMQLMKDEEDKVDNHNRNSLLSSLSIAHKQITREKIEGSTTLCFVKIIEKTLQSYLLGDSAYMLIYENTSKFYKSSEQQKSFNFPYQLGSEGDKITDGKQRAHPLAVGDIIVVATDGIFDNLSEEYIYGIVKEDKEKSTMDIASRIVNEATLVAFNRHPKKNMNITPFQINSEGYFKGGKADDMTLIVARVKRL